MNSSRINLLFVTLILLVISCDTANNVDPLYKNYFVKYYGEDGDHSSVDLVVNSDGTFVLLGSIVSPTGNQRIFVTKVDASGNQIWESELGDVNEYPQDIEPISGGYIILSNVLVDAVNDNFQFKLLRIDESGNKTDSLQYDTFFDQTAKTVTPLSDGGFFVAGKTKESDIANTHDDGLAVQEQEDLLLVRFDNTFLKQNSTANRIGASSVGSAVKVFEFPAGYYVYVASSDELIGGETGSASEFELNFIFRKFQFAPDGVETTYVGDNSKNETMSYATVDASGLIYAIGTAVTPATSSSNILLTKINSTPQDPTPTKIFSKDFGSGTKVEGVSVFPNGAYCYVLANKVDDASGTRDIWLTRVNAFDGSQSGFWSEGLTFGTLANDDFGSRVYEAANGDIIVLGTINITNQKKMALIRINSKGDFE